MDLFNRRRIVELEIELQSLQDQNHALTNQVECLVRTIRDIDQGLYNMSQKTSWDGMRPSFAKLMDKVTARKVAESKRISEILRPELIQTYATSPKVKRITNK